MGNIYRLVILAIAACLALTGCAARESSMITVTLDHNEESATGVAVTDGRAVIDVTDPRGINGLTASLAEGEWPAEVVVLLRLEGLEFLEIGYGNVTMTTGLSSNESPDPPLMLSVTDEQGQVQTASPSSDVYYPAINKTADGFEIILPPHFHLDEHDSFSMQWIDFYR